METALVCELAFEIREISKNELISYEGPYSIRPKRFVKITNKGATFEAFKTGDRVLVSVIGRHFRDVPPTKKDQSRQTGMTIVGRLHEIMDNGILLKEFKEQHGIAAEIFSSPKTILIAEELEGAEEVIQQYDFVEIIIEKVET